MQIEWLEEFCEDKKVPMETRCCVYQDCMPIFLDITKHLRDLLPYLYTHQMGQTAKSLIAKLESRMNNYQILANFNDIVVIKDLNWGVSVTNSAQEVIYELKEFLVDKKALYYFDTAGELDQILFDDNFKFLGITTARAKAKEITDRIKAGK